MYRLNKMICIKERSYSFCKLIRNVNLWIAIPEYLAIRYTAMFTFYFNH